MFRLDDTTAATESQATEPRASFGKPVDIGRVALRIRRARWWFGGMGVVGAAIGVALAKFAAPVEYESQATLEWEPDDIEQADRTRAEKTLIDSIALPTALADIRLHLDLPMTLEQLKKKLDVTTTPQSNVLILSAKSHDPESAQKLAEYAVATLLDQREHHFRDRALDEETRLEADLARADEAAQTARGDLLGFRRDHNLVDVTVETQTQNAQVAKLSAEADTAPADAAAEAARSTALREHAANEGQTAVHSERVIHPVAVKLAEMKADRATLQAELSNEHPKVQALDSAEEALKRTLGSEGRGATAEQTVGRNPEWDALEESLMKAEADESALKTRENEYATLADTAERRLNQLGEVEGPAGALLETLKTAEKRLDDIAIAYAKAKDAAASPQSGLRTLAPPDLPAHPQRSLAKIIAIATPVALLVIALLVVLVRIFWGLRLYTAAELAFHARLPVFAASSWPGLKEHLDELVVDVSEATLSATDDVAILGLTPSEGKLASRLARRLRKHHAEVGAPTPNAQIVTSAFSIDSHHPEVRRTIRRSRNVFVVVKSGAHSLLKIRTLGATFDSSQHVALLLVDVAPELAFLPERVGDARRLLALST